MAQDNRALVFELDARTEKLERAFDRANKSANDNMKAIERQGDASARRIDASFARTATSVAASMASTAASGYIMYQRFQQIEQGANLAGTAMRKVLNFVIGYRVAIATFTALGLAANQAAETIERMQQIAAKANTAGVGTTFLQSWTNQAEKLGVTVENVEKALISARGALRDQADDLGKLTISPVQKLLDELYRSGQVVGRGLDDFLKSGNVEQRIQAIKIAIQELLNAGRDLQANKLGEMVFGAGVGEKIVSGIRSGAVAVEAMGTAAQSAGNTFDAALIQKADELDQRLKVARAELSNAFVPILNDIASIGLTINSGWVTINETIARAAQTLGNFYTVSKAAYAAVSAANAEVYSNRRAQARIGMTQRGPDAIISDEQISDQRARAEIAYKLRAGQLDKRGDISNLPDGSAAFLPNTALPQNPPVPSARPTYTELQRQPRAPAAGGNAGGAQGFDQVEGYLNRLQRSTELLQVEAAAMDKSKVEREKMVRMVEAEAQARSRGTPLSEKEREQVEATATAYANASQKLEALQQRRESLNQSADLLGNQLIDGFDAIALRGESAASVIKSLISVLIKAVAQAALLGSGPFAGLFGTAGASGATGGIFGAFMKGFGLTFAEGGYVSGPGTTTSDSIPAWLSDKEFVINAKATQQYRPLLEAINSGRVPKFAAGGAVRGLSMPTLPSLPASVQPLGAGSAPVINISSPITVNGSSGTPAQNADLAKQMGRQMEQAMRTVVVSELQKQLRPGNLLNR
ncbi:MULTISPECIES: hypothetical protein [unclassified Beijerinckia]|uniref:hypothetical protein n=1 Tax=unclassified Beijerinckia TaxID=2638183 RepID=UPI00089D0D51|nr:MULTISPECIES: hypothetical protein [unclassified Beijerinckia]MDH7795803.1 hypothetical protein [Beijerinckia sp. GAS462]SEC17054.1 hypothetical protein SAMN05443249_2081 [Beijerinckia sp. 28-YEA-48]